MSGECDRCGNNLNQYEFGRCSNCSDDEESRQYEASNAEEGREECEREPDRITHEGREYYRLADGAELLETDIFDTSLESEMTNFRAIVWPRQCQTESRWDGYWRPVERDFSHYADALGYAFMGLDPGPIPKIELSGDTIVIPRYLAKDVLADLSPQMVSKAVRELLKLIEEQL